jgi:hypothetical protein
MTYIVKNVRDHPIEVDGVVITPGEQLKVDFLTGPISNALDAGDLHMADGDETRAERQADVDAIEPFHNTGDPAIDGPPVKRSR